MPDESRGTGAAAPIAEDLFPHSAKATGPRHDRRVATVLFADIVGSTRMVADTDPEDAQEILTLVLNAMAPHIARFGGTLCQTLGDGILAVFGAPDALEDHAVRACYAAEAIVRAVRREKRVNAAVRVGVCTGEIMWDGSALNRSDRPPAVGRTVHLAAKLQQSAPANRVRLSASTAVRVADWIDVEPAADVQITPSEAARSYDLLGPFMRRRRRRDDAVPTIGRDAEIRTLTEGMHRAAQGRGGACLVTGVAGIGKSRLAEDSVKIAHRAGLRAVEWQMHAVRPVGAPDPLTEITGLLLDLPSIPGQRTVLTSLLATLGMKGPQVEALADILLPDQRRNGMDAQSLLTMAAKGAAELAAAVARDEPMLLVVEDLHWAGPEARAVLESLAPNLAQAGIFVLATSRQNADWLTPADRRPLAPITGSDCEALLSALMGDDPGLNQLKRELRNRAQGNPFFLSQCVLGLVEEGALAGQAGALRATGKPAGKLPEDIQVLLMSRIDTLPEDPRDLLLKSAVIGQVIDLGLLAALDGADRFDARLQTLTGAGYLDPVRLVPRPEYVFRHALVQEAGYATLPKKERKRLHGRIADLMEGAAFAGLSGRLAIQARHAFRADLWEKAEQTGYDAGCAALDRADCKDAVDLLEISKIAAERAGLGDADLKRSFELRYALGRSNVPIGNGVSAIDHLTAASELARIMGDPEREARVLLMIASHQVAYGNLRIAIESLRKAQAILPCSELSSGAHPQISAVLGMALLDAGAMAEAKQTLSTASDALGLRVSPKFLALDMAIVALSKLAVLNAAIGDAARAREFIARALDAADRSDLPGDIVIASTYCSEASFELGDMVSTAELTARALDGIGSTAIGVLRPVAQARNACANLLLGADPGQLGTVDDALCSAESKKLLGHIPKIAVCRIVGLQHLDRHEDALHCATAAMRHAVSAGAHLARLQLRRRMLISAQKLGRADIEAESAAQITDLEHILGIQGRGFSRPAIGASTA